MISEILTHLSGWSSLDTWTVLTAALAAMACALPGNYLLLRRQSMMGDAISHTALLGIVLAFLFAHAMRESGWISEAGYVGAQHALMLVGAMFIGVFSAVLTEWIRKLGSVEHSAALGVVFTSLFALGLLLIRVAADNVHIDPDCVLYGTIETVVLDTIPGTEIPRAAVVNGGMLLVNGFLVMLFYKELQLAAFDPSLATTLGINARLMHYGLMAITAASLVAAFESVGSILVIAMLIVPAATASLLTERLSRMIVLSLVIAAASALLGHAAAISLPPVIFSRLGFPSVVDASTAGMMAVACGSLFVVAMLFAPKQGLLTRFLLRQTMRIKIAAEDVLGYLYRVEESAAAKPADTEASHMSETLGMTALVARLATWRLRWKNLVAHSPAGYRLTPSGRTLAERLIRSHRLFESYMSKHFDVPDDHLHETASRVEHYIDRNLQEQLANELDRPGVDPHGKSIPGEPCEG